MMRSIVTSPFEINRVAAKSYNLLVATCGFEDRARRVVEQHQPRGTMCWAPAFCDRQELAFADNRQFFVEQGFDVGHIEDARFAMELKDRINSVAPSIGSNESLKILVDVSSMSRLRMASIVDVARCSTCPMSIEIDFLYCVAEYTEPPGTSFPIVECGPVTSTFAGWSHDPTQRTVAVFGAGYEQDQVIGVLDLLEAAEVWVFVPIGPDKRYLESVNKANLTLWDEVPESHRLAYPVLSPFETFMQVESLLYGLLANRRPIVVPFGPKIFTVVSLLACASLHPRVPLWRVSTGQIEPPINQRGTSHYAGISAQFVPGSEGV